VGQLLFGQIVKRFVVSSVTPAETLAAIGKVNLAEVVLDDELLKQLSEGQNAIFVVFKTPEEGIGIPVSLNGFGDGFAQLP